MLKRWNIKADSSDVKLLNWYFSWIELSGMDESEWDDRVEAGEDMGRRLVCVQSDGHQMLLTPVAAAYLGLVLFAFGVHLQKKNEINNT